MDYDEGVLYIFTDGSSRKVRNEKLKKKTGIFGGKGIIFIYYDKNLILQKDNKSDFKSHIDEAAPKMELGACIDGLELALEEDLSNFSKIIIATDSNYVCENEYRATWIWPNTKWVGKNNIPIDHVEDRKKLTKIRQKISNIHHLRVEFMKVKAHDGVEGNEDADISAVKGAQSTVRVNGEPKLRRRKFLKSKPGNVNVAGKELYIHIFSTRRFKVQRTNKYRYEIVSWGIDDFKKTNATYYQGTLYSSYIYKVRFSDDPNNPSIEEIIATEEKEDIKKIMIGDGISLDNFN